MRQTGNVLIIISVALGLYAFFMDTSVKTGTSGLGLDRVSNLSLMNLQENLLFISGIICITGTLLVVGGTLANKMEAMLTSNYAQKDHHVTSIKDSDESYLSAAHRALKSKYERSEISLEEYQKEWNKLV